MIRCFTVLILTFILSSCAKENHLGVIGLAVKDSKSYEKSGWKDTEISRKISKAGGAKFVKIYGLENAAAGYDKITVLKNANFEAVIKDEELSKIFVKEGDYLKLQKPLEDSFGLSADTCLFKLGDDLVLCDKAFQAKLSELGKSYADDLYSEFQENSKEAVIIVAPSLKQIDTEKLIDRASRNFGFSHEAYAKGLKKKLETLKKIKSISVVTCDDESVKMKIEFKDSALAREAMVVFDGKAGSMSDFSLANKMKISFNDIAVPALKLKGSTISGTLKPSKDRVRLSRFIGTALQIYNVEIEGSKEEVPVKFASYTVAESDKLRELTVEEVKKQLNESFKIEERKYNEFFKSEKVVYSYSGLPSQQVSVYLEPKAYDVNGKELKARDQSSDSTIYIDYNSKIQKPGKLKLTVNASAHLNFDSFELSADDIGKVKTGKFSSVKLIKLENDVYEIENLGSPVIRIDCLDENGKALHKISRQGVTNLARNVSGRISKLRILVQSEAEKVTITKEYDLSK